MSSYADGGLGWEAAETLCRENRPTIGDHVKILDTENTREFFPDGVGGIFEIRTGEDQEPYQVKGSNAWLFEDDVETLKDGPSRRAILARLSREGALAAMQEDPSLLEFVSEAWRADHEVVLAAVRQNPRVLAYASEELRADHEIQRQAALAAVRENPRALGGVSEVWRADREVVLAAVRRAGFALKFASEELRADREIVLAAMREHIGALEYVSDELVLDHDVRQATLAAVRGNPRLLESVSEVWRADREVMLAAVRQMGSMLRFASKELRADREIVLAAMQEDFKAQAYASEELSKDHNFIREGAIAAVERDPRVLERVPGAWRADREVVLAAVRQCGDLLIHASEELRADRDIVLAAMKDSSSAVRYVSDKLFQDPEVQQGVRAAVQANPQHLEDVFKMWRSDREIVLAGVRQNGNVLQYASDDLRKDREIVLVAMETKTMTSGERPGILKMALPPLNQDFQMLEVAGLALERFHLVDGQFLPEVVLSVKFSLTREASNLANELYLKIARDERFNHFYVHNPNVFRKGFCGLTYKYMTTASGEPDEAEDDGRGIYGWDGNTLECTCRGDCGVSCWKEKEDPAHSCKRDHPEDPLKYGCWRFVYRRHLQKAKDTQGCMLQLEEESGLGVGQQVEREMAREVGVNVIVLEAGRLVKIYQNELDKIAALMSGRPGKPSDRRKDYFGARVYRLGDLPGVSSPVADSSPSTSAAPARRTAGRPERAPEGASEELEMKERVKELIARLADSDGLIATAVFEELLRQTGSEGQACSASVAAFARGGKVDAFRWLAWAFSVDEAQEMAA